MSLLGDLKIAYEILADDPIEVGIHYGHSILNVLSQNVMPAQQFAFATVPSTNFMAREVAVKPRVHRVVPSTPAPITRELPVVTATRGRDYSNFITRSPASRSTVAYSQRNLIGAL